LHEQAQETGSGKEIEAFRRWLCLSHFVAEGRRLAAV